MKPFNLKAAKAGEPIVTRDGRETRFIAYVPEVPPEFRVLVLVKEYGLVSHCTEDGSCRNAEWDLFMAPVKRTVWVNLYSREEKYSKDKTRTFTCSVTYPSEQAALAGAAPAGHTGAKHIGAFPIEYED